MKSRPKKNVVQKSVVQKQEIPLKPEKLIAPPPDTFPKEPISHIGKCLHSNKKFVVGKAGYDCFDCGFFITIASIRYNKVEEVPHVAVEHITTKLTVPKIDNFRMVELPKSIFGVESLLKENLGERDKEKLISFNKLLIKYKIHSFQVSGSNYVFLLI